MSQAQVDRIWSAWRKEGKDRIFHSQFKPKPERAVENMTMYEYKYFSSGSRYLAWKTQIPTTIHQTYKTAARDKIEPSRLAYMDTWITMNRGFQYRLWTDSEMWSFVTTFYPRRIQKAYDKLPMIVQKSDFFRYLVLYKYGGYYTDTDTRCARHVNWWRMDHETDDVEFIAGLEWYIAPPDFPDTPISITNWAFASAPGHVVLNRTVEAITDRVLTATAEELRDVTNVVEITGPLQFTKIILRYLSDKGWGYAALQAALKEGETVFFKEGGVLLLPPVAFNPGSFQPNTTVRDVRTVLYHEFAGNTGWKKEVDKSSWI
ncbi:nucleotide-diphospho-sugar transferase [Chytriomyces cf. hyalinus JEL632]|nr:nucleotide-diphospho-sugar transferase [Chytriomyces cf. hyalinus JEL632]